MNIQRLDRSGSGVRISLVVIALAVSFAAGPLGEVGAGLAGVVIVVGMLLVWRSSVAHTDFGPDGIEVSGIWRSTFISWSRVSAVKYGRVRRDVDDTALRLVEADGRQRLLARPLETDVSESRLVALATRADAMARAPRREAAPYDPSDLHIRMLLLVFFWSFGVIIGLVAVGGLVSGVAKRVDPIAVPAGRVFVTAVTARGELISSVGCPSPAQWLAGANDSYCNDASREATAIFVGLVGLDVVLFLGIRGLRRSRRRIRAGGPP